MKSLFRTDKDVASVLGQLLRAGVVTSSVIALIGGVIYLMAHGADRPHYTEFIGAPENLRHINGIIAGLLVFDAQAIIQTGVLVLIATPILRVLLSAIAFAIEKDYLYVIITLIVLSIIAIGMFGGLGG
ncbi:DUF1634 domain-containing protein [Arcticibacter eurypsychrophilus]|uniref:DUF1634 domain-containing protein n=1 Tax=Arcticibacter eurypsychrophilus TaxID=1434752 RepID=UPI00084D972D|nr:DUF1634 domain-containing protein [Arcticibacter eurypsychrophilus]